MSLAIDVDRVSEVLLADGWHDVKFVEGQSTFEIDAYEYIRKHEGRTDPDVRQGVPSTGATWFDVNPNAQIYCPVTSILAVMVKEQVQAQAPVGDASAGRGYTGPQSILPKNR